MSLCLSSEWITVYDHQDLALYRDGQCLCRTSDMACLLPYISSPFCVLLSATFLGYIETQLPFRSSEEAFRYAIEAYTPGAIDHLLILKRKRKKGTALFFCPKDPVEKLMNLLSRDTVPCIGLYMEHEWLLAHYPVSFLLKKNEFQSVWVSQDGQIIAMMEEMWPTIKKKLGLPIDLLVHDFNYREGVTVLVYPALLLKKSLLQTHGIKNELKKVAVVRSRQWALGRHLRQYFNILLVFMIGAVLPLILLYAPKVYDIQRDMNKISHELEKKYGVHSRDQVIAAWYKKREKTHRLRRDDAFVMLSLLSDWIRIAHLSLPSAWHYENRQLTVYWDAFLIENQKQIVQELSYDVGYKTSFSINLKGSKAIIIDCWGKYVQEV